MHAEISDPDYDIESVEWFGDISNARPDYVTSADQRSVTLNAPTHVTFVRAKVRVEDARGNEDERNCPLEFDERMPTPHISSVSAKEGEPLVFEVTLDRAPSSAVTYYYATRHGTAGAPTTSGRSLRH